LLGSGKTTFVKLLTELKSKSKTVFVVTHDDRYYNVADRIIKLDEGRIVGDTRHVSEFLLLEKNVAAG